VRSGGWIQVRAIWQGYLRGRTARWLQGEDYLQLANEPLEAARRRLNITPPTIYDQVSAAARDW
jgi:ubiquinone biosynthesis protein COQ4